MEINKPSHRWQLRFEGEWPTALTFLGSSRRLAAGNRSGQLLIWELPETPPEPEKQQKEPTPPDCPPVRQLLGHTNGISQLRATADGKTLISASLDRTIRLWDPNAPATGTAEIVLNPQERERQARNRPAAEKEAILKAPGHTLETCGCLKTLEEHRDWVTALALSRDGHRLLSGDDASRVIAWDLPGGTRLAEWKGYPWNGIAALALSPDGQTALVSEYRYKRDDFDIPAAALKLWNVADGAEKLDLLKLQFPKLDPTASSYGAAQVWRGFVHGGLIAADFSPDGQLLAVGQGGETDTGKVPLFEVSTGKLLRTVSGHQYGVCDVKFSADGRYLLSSGRDTLLRICQVSDGKEVATLGKERGGQFKDWLHALAISPDQQTIAAADIAGLIHVWQLNS